MKEKSIGRPTKYKPEFAEQARKFCLLKGATDEQLAEYFGVAESTIKEWYKKHPEFSAHTEAGKEMADANVAEGLYKRATGYEYNETTFEKIDDKKALEMTPDALITVDVYKKKIVTKHLPPDSSAALNWLKNRQPQDWRDKIAVEHSGKIDTTDLSNLSDEQLKQLLAESLAKTNAEHGQS